MPDEISLQTNEALAARQVAALRNVLSVISDSRANEQPVFDTILENACALCNAPLAGLILGTPDDAVQTLAAQTGMFAAAIDLFASGQMKMDPNLSYAARSILEGRLIAFDDMADSDLYRAGSPVVRSMVDTSGIRSVLFVPLIRDGAAIGNLTLFRREISPFDPSEIALVEAFAAQAVIAVENVRQFREVQTRLEREQASAEILAVISQSRDDEQPVLETIVRNAAALTHAYMVGISLTNAAGTHLSYAATWGPTSTHFPPGFQFDLSGPLQVAVTVREARTIHKHDLADDPLYEAGDPVRRMIVDEVGIRTFLTVPLIKNGVAFGCLNLNRDEVRAFTADEIKLVETFAAQAVIAIENVRQFRQLEARLAREAASRDILQIISQSRGDDTPVFDAILGNAARLCRAPMAWLLLIDEAQTEMTLAAYHGLARRALEIGDTWPVRGAQAHAGLGTAFFEARSAQDEDLAQSEAYLAGDPNIMRLVHEEGLRTRLSVPLVSGGHCIGAIVLSRREVSPFSAEDAALVDTFAEQAVIAIENVRQYKALEALNAELGDRVESQVGEIERMGKLKRFLPAAVADTVVSSGSEDMLKSHRALLGVLFCDIRGFTAFCETAEPEETIEVLQTYHEEMGKLINAHGAGVDHRMGDGIMVLFNDPVPCDDPAGTAVRLAQAMQARMAELCAMWKRLGHRLGFGVGISLGYATVGMVGYEGRSDYTASGTAVNLAARLCDLAEDGDILLSARAAIAVEDNHPVEVAGQVTLKGIREPVEVFRLKSDK